ncbi:Uu.00g052540.m01.CDS01 [Anthostomella pinea]|uniref:Uu.00g052540.m01.CDS01 n=1 Tax=Anthostomella pinea TaxID=933095 RepID=A0AAI8VWZ8_9PEZI|nr:Uu.00g052540.m01.CDS01 [Anthostomella pinea]
MAGTTPPAQAQQSSCSKPKQHQQEMKPRKSINLLRGWPSTSLLPAEGLRAASQTALSDPAVFDLGLQYGPDHGYQPLREELGRWLGRFYHPHIRDDGEGGNGGVDADRIAITGGASQSIACILQSFTDPSYTRAVWMVAPCYFLACPIFADAGFERRLRAVPEDEEGIDLGFLEDGLRKMAAAESDEGDGESAGGQGKGEGEGEDQEKGQRRRYKDPGPHRKIYRHVIYCVPSFSNPSGKTMSLRRRQGLVRLAREHDALVICDDVYDMLQWPVSAACPSSPSPSTPSPSSSPSSSTTATPDVNSLTTALLPRLADLDIPLGRSPHDPSGQHFGHTVSNGSFSKLVAPGVRTGWTYSTPAFATGISQTGSTRSGGAPSQLTATILCEILCGGAVERHVVEVLRPAYQRRHKVLMDASERVLTPLGVRVREGSLCGRGDVFGGFFVWMSFPSEDSSTSSSETMDMDRKTENGKERTHWPSAKAVADRCSSDEDLMIGWGGLFEVHGDEAAVRFERDVRLCFAYEDEAHLVEGVERLGRVIGRMLEEGPGGWEGTEKGKGQGDVAQIK